jgi:methanogenic corrinoid protein MtbC1
MDDHKVSELCTMPDEKLFELIKTRLIAKPSESNSAGYFVSQLIAAGMTYDTKEFEKIFSACVLKFGVKGSYVQVIYPLLNRIGLLWASDVIPPAQEHFISNIIRQKLFSEIEKIPPASNTSDTWILFLPENEFHEIGLLLAYYLIRKTGRKVIYLGSSVPLQAITDSVKQIKPSSLLLFFVHNDLEEAYETYCDSLRSHFKKLKIYIAGPEKLEDYIKHKGNITLLHTVNDLEKIIK